MHKVFIYLTLRSLPICDIFFIFLYFSVLLERGSKLRNAMVVSALKSDMESDVPLKDVPPTLFKDNSDALYEHF